MGYGIEFSRYQHQSRSSGIIPGSSGNSSSRDSMSEGGEEESESGGRQATLYRSIYPFPGTNEDEVYSTSAPNI